MLVAMPDSIHVARWIKLLDKREWDVHLFPSTSNSTIHPELDGVTLHSPLLALRAKKIEAQTASKVYSSFAFLVDFLLRRVFHRFMLGFGAWRLHMVVEKIRPQLIHSLEIQAAGYLTLDTKARFGKAFPLWLVTNWGSDIFLFGRLRKHQAKVAAVLANCDYYSCECERDLKLARKLGFRGQMMPAFPNTGGFDLLKLEEERNRIPTSSRKLILLKGYQNWAGRALVGLRSLSRCRDVLAGYTVAIYSASADVAIAAELFATETGIRIQMIPEQTSHQDMLSFHARARISIGLSISDGISTSFLEALVMGSYPIQSCTACADEWITHGTSGTLVPPEDPDIIEVAIRDALLDDDLVNRASAINWKTAQGRLNASLMKEKAESMYLEILKGV